ncbi:MAG: competence/damage-inducible protein A, partial [Thermomicrobiales bacterium]|nr:competence/damage-inducible protein A [Thermomicrobiales bacterium]
MLGHLTDTNATYLAQQLAGLGIELTLVTQVGDDLARLSAAIERASVDAEIVICTGGVGPTADDLTREAIATVMGETPMVDDELLETIRAFFRLRGIDMPERNKKQAWLIPSAEALPNPVGTAPGWFVRRGERVIAAMPGVPREMFRMWSEQVVPRLVALEGASAVRSITLRTIGIGESAVEQVLHDLVALTDPVVATYAKDDGVHVRVTAVSADPREAERVRDSMATEVTRRLADHIYASDDVTLPQALAALLRSTGNVLAISDSGGGGRFASLIAGHPDSAPLLALATLTTAPGSA